MLVPETGCALASPHGALLALESCNVDPLGRACGDEVHKTTAPRERAVTVPPTDEATTSRSTPRGVRNDARHHPGGGLWSPATRKSSRALREGLRAVASDLDGTLLGIDGLLSPRTVEAVRKLQQAGYRFILATARPVPDALNLARQLGTADPLICQNGAIVYSQELAGVISRNLLHWRVVRRVVEIVRDADSGATIAIDYPRQRLTDPNWGGPVGRLPAQAGLWHISPDLVDRRYAACVLVRSVNEALLQALNCISSITVTSSLSGLVEISRDGVHKGAALAWLCGELGFALDEVIAFGDMPNDTEMLRAVGIGVAMGNAERNVKDQADIVTESNAEDGVALVLEDLITAG